MKRAICIGINNYPGYINDLQGCLNDAKDWSGLLVNQFGFEPPTVILDGQATVKCVKEHVIKMVNEAQAGDILVWTYSGHGTSVPSLRPDKPDGRAEAICLYDGLLLDSDIRTILNNLKPDVHMTVISDSCHSGTLTRLQRVNRFSLEDETAPKKRYMPPEDEHFARGLRSLQVTDRVFRMIDQSVMPEVLLSGCRADEYSNDAYIEGNYCGAFSFYALRILKQNPSITYQGFYDLLRKDLPSQDFKQTPQLEASPASRNRPVFS